MNRIADSEVKEMLLAGAATLTKLTDMPEVDISTEARGLFQNIICLMEEHINRSNMRDATTASFVNLVFLSMLIGLRDHANLLAANIVLQQLFNVPTCDVVQSAEPPAPNIIKPH